MSKLLFNFGFFSLKIKKLLIINFLILSLTSCKLAIVPERKLINPDIKQIIKLYYDYYYLEKKGIQRVKLIQKDKISTLTLPEYLYTLGKSFEELGSENNAKKIYLRLLVNYPIIYKSNQLGVEVENRFNWLVGSKDWLKPNVDELILKLEKALSEKKQSMLKGLISRDFGFGSNQKDRFVINYKEALQIICKGFKNTSNFTMEIIPQTSEKKMVLKTTGWENGEKIWYFILNKNIKRKSWEWNLAYWELK